MSALLLVQAGLLANPALAQDVQPTDGPPADVSDPSGPVEGQPIPSTSAEGEPVDSSQDIVVTGSRIPQPNLESASPVSVVSDQDVKLSGAVRIEDVLAQLPSATASQSSGVSNAATGTAEIDLRFLGAKRTLVLVNGRRLMPGSPSSASQAADVNVIPASLLRRVEVLTGGASSVYGADAVAGVVNFIMDTEFEGIRFDGNYSFYQHKQQNPGLVGGLDMRDIHEDAGFPFPTGSRTDGAAFDGTVSIGAGFDDDRGHAVAYFGYRKVKPVLQRDRDYSSCVINGSGEGLFCGGSATSAEGNFFTSDFDIFTFAPNREVVAGYTLFNFAPLNYYQRPDERYTAGAFANYEISDQIKPYLEFMFMDDRTLAQIAPSGAFFGSVNTINCDSPLLSAQAQSVICAPGNLVTGFLGTFPSTNDAPVGPFDNDVDEAPFIFTDAQGNEFTRGFFQLGRRNVEGGPRIADLKHTAYRGVLGTRGDLSNVFSYDAYFQYGRTNYSLVYKNEFSISRLNRALNVVNVDANGVIVPVGTPGSSTVCRSVLDQTDPQCVPYDVFGTITPEALNYLNIFGVVQGFTSEQIANANITAQLGEMGFRTPWAEDGVAVNFGAEYRKESLELNPDQSFQALPSSDLAGQGGPTLPTSGSFRVLEAFAEAQIPLVQDNFIDEFTINLGFRRSGYDLSNGNSFTTNTYKISAELAPVRDVRFRGAYNRAVRAPNIQELFGPQFVGLNGSIDPCADIVISATDFGCLAQGLSVGDSTPSNPAEQYNGFIGGNPDLRPEKATTKTIGVVLQPRFIPGLAVTVDYFNIKLTGAVQGFGQDAILSDCVENATATFTPASCALVNRDPAGSIWLSALGFVTDLPNNQGGIKTDGVDANAAYRHNLGGMGSLSASLLGTWVRRYVTDNGLSEPYDCAGFYGSICSAGTVSSSSPIPKWRHKLRTTWESPWGLGISAQWRHISKVRHERTSDDATLSAAGAPPEQGRRVKAYNYLDLAATYSLLDRINLRAGVNNVFDKDPPRITSSAGSCPTGPCNGNTYPGTWDALGRYVWMGATIDFLPPKPMALAPPPVVAPPPPPAAPATQTCPDGSVILATDACPAPPPPPPPPAPEPERG
jgi:outer membrane receptor protein involved in Fe transport